MLTALLVVALVVGITGGALAALLVIVSWRQRVREAVLDRQVRLTDAIHRDLGAVVAPTVRSNLFGPWTVSMAVPLARPDLLARVLAVVDRALAAERDPRPVRIVLTPREEGR